MQSPTVIAQLLDIIDHSHISVLLVGIIRQAGRPRHLIHVLDSDYFQLGLTSGQWRRHIKGIPDKGVLEHGLSELGIAVGLVHLERDDILAIIEIFLSGIQVFQLAIAIEVVEELCPSLDDLEGFGVNYNRPEVFPALQLVDDLEPAFRLTLDS